jgi:hypothetical protein
MKRYKFKHKHRDNDFIVVDALDIYKAYDKLWDTILMVPGLYMYHFNLFTITKTLTN